MDLTNLVLLANMIFGPVSVGLWLLVYGFLVPASTHPGAVNNIITSSLGAGLWMYLLGVRNGQFG